MLLRATAQFVLVFLDSNLCLFEELKFEYMCFFHLPFAKGKIACCSRGSGGKMWRDLGTPADSYYQVRPECSTDVPESKFRIKAGKTLSPRKWKSSFSPEGYLDIGKTLSRICRGGIHPSIRGEVWEFLLGCFDPNSTFEERDQIRQHRRVKYRMLKEECRQMFSLVGSGRFVTAPIITDDGQPIQDPIVLQQINLEENPESRTQENGFINGSHVEKHPNGHSTLSKKEIQWKLTLHQIGMSDLCSPMIIVLEDEADAFWCFVHLMRRLRGNFRGTERSVGVEAQLGKLASVTQVIDPKLHQHLETLGAGNYLFAIRMLMVMFRREFSFADALYLWEMMWALEYDPELYSVYEDSESAAANERSGGESRVRTRPKRHCGKFEREYQKNRGKNTAAAPLPISVFLVASVLKEKSSKLTEARGLDDVVQILNEVTGNIDAKKACTGAMKLHKKYLKKAKNT
ncbi:uncharacterized protein LOC127247781 isoform X3 [Andrographis paniculata]|uniref:uncharacterized protein LOC127247781 isoform X3 n=1 Tax=Andrographis paniculata TaxID=175694 RepID=UPI0021E750FB|nr:uncharacterized protein LOC127247781 isoform X3 [Andrographis paniculata]